MPHTWDPDSPTPEQALQRLIDGNARFLEKVASAKKDSGGQPWHHRLATDPQRPFAIVLGCSDSRTPVEALFDQGFGELFVVRVAGNIVAPSIVGSIEFAASQFGTRLVVVLGHTRCGAVGATAHALVTGGGSDSKNIRSITDRISPHIQGIIKANSAEPTPELLREAGRANIRASADHLRHGSRLLEELVEAGRVVVVGAEYELETGRVHFFDRPAQSSSAPPSG